MRQFPDSNTLTRVAQFTLQLGALAFPSRMALRDSAKRYLFSRERIPAAPEGLIEPAADSVRQFVNAMNGSRKLLLTGRSGSGKTTLAIEMHRKLVDGRERTLHPAMPVFVRLPRLTQSKDLVTSFVDLVSHYVASNGSRFRHLIAKRMIAGGSLLMILDDLDYLDCHGFRRLQEFIQSQSRHYFVCIVSEKPKSSSFWDEFDSMHLLDWDAVTAKTYIRNRVPNKVNCDTLLYHLDALEIFKRKRSALEWKCLVDTYNEGRIFELFHPKGFYGNVEYGIQKNYLRIVIENLGLDFTDCIRQVGGLALRLLKQGESGFEPGESAVSPKFLQALKPRLFKEYGSLYAFAESPQQVLLAGAYIALFEKEARQDMQDDLATNLIWTPVYNSACVYTSKERTHQIHEFFCKLASRSPVKAGENPISPDLEKRESGGHSDSVAQDEPRWDVEDYGIIESQVRSRLLASGIEYIHGIKTLGHLSLKLATERRMFFHAEEAEQVMNKDVWERLRPKRSGSRTGVAETEPSIEVLESGLLMERQGRLNFIHNRLQTFLAGTYLGEFWPSARIDLRGNPLENALLMDAYRFALCYMSKEQASELKDAFQRNQAPIEENVTQADLKPAALEALFACANEALKARTEFPNLLKEV